MVLNIKITFHRYTFTYPNVRCGSIRSSSFLYAATISKSKSTSTTTRRPASTASASRATGITSSATTTAPSSSSTTFLFIQLYNIIKTHIQLIHGRHFCEQACTLSSTMFLKQRAHFAEKWRLPPVLHDGKSWSNSIHKNIIFIFKIYKSWIYIINK